MIISDNVGKSLLHGTNFRISVLRILQRKTSTTTVWDYFELSQTE